MEAPLIETPEDEYISGDKVDWVEDNKQCNRVAYGNSAFDSSLRCYWINDKFTIIKLEVVNREPMILRYHELLHRRKCKRLIEASKLMSIKETTVVGKTPKTRVKSKGRNANGTWISHHFPPEINEMFNTVQRAVLTYDMSYAELFQILSYEAGGYYVPHFDYLEPTAAPDDVRDHGNRIATMLVIIKTAKDGGTTIFPNLNINIRPNAGDVLLWNNMDATGSLDLMSFHAACPIKAGQKIGISLWIREKGQEIRAKCETKKRYLMDRFFQPLQGVHDIPLFTHEVVPFFGTI